MNILCLGGTGAIGRSLIPLLLKHNNIQLYITSRRGGLFSENSRIVYYQCNAMEIVQLKGVLKRNEYDVIIDFMNYHTADFKKRYELLLSTTKHYVFISSCRIFADQNIISESSVQILDALDNIEYLKNDTYALAKARCERVLKESPYTNYTIIRPYITYNSNRFQLGIYEKEHFLYRALKGRPIVVSCDILDKKTSLTSSEDVANLISILVRKQPIGKCYNLVSTESVTWRDILKIYIESISQHIGREVKVKYTSNSEIESKLIYSEEKYHLDRLYNRLFKSEEEEISSYNFAAVSEDLKRVLEYFYKDPSFGVINWDYEAYLDRVCGSSAKYAEFPSLKSFAHYLKKKFNIHNLS